LRQALREDGLADTDPATAQAPYAGGMYYVGGFAIGIVLVVVLVVAAAKTMRKR